MSPICLISWPLVRSLSTPPSLRMKRRPGVAAVEAVLRAVDEVLVAVAVDVAGLDALGTVRGVEPDLRCRHEGAVDVAVEAVVAGPAVVAVGRVG